MATSCADFPTPPSTPSVGSGLLRLKVPVELGGHEAEPGLQFEVFERVAMVNVAAAWCYFIWADSVGDACARLTDDGLARLLADDDVPIVCGGGGLRPGVLRPVPGGYRMTGTFRYGSGIHAASWVLLLGRADRDDGRPEMRACLVAKDDLTLADDWHVLGMRGTGSVGFAADDVFVPAEMTYAASARPRRGGRVYRTGIIGYLGFPLPAVTLAIARRALDELTTTASNLTRGYTRPRTLAERATFQHFLGEADVRLAAARALMLARGTDLMDAVELPRDARAPSRPACAPPAPTPRASPRTSSPTSCASPAGRPHARAPCTSAPCATSPWPPATSSWTSRPTRTTPSSCSVSRMPIRSPDQRPAGERHAHVPSGTPEP